MSDSFNASDWSRMAGEINRDTSEDLESLQQNDINTFPIENDAYRILYSRRMEIGESSFVTCSECDMTINSFTFMAHFSEWHPDLISRYTNGLTVPARENITPNSQNSSIDQNKKLNKIASQPTQNKIKPISKPKTLPKQKIPAQKVKKNKKPLPLPSVKPLPPVRPLHTQYRSIDPLINQYVAPPTPPTPPENMFWYITSDRPKVKPPSPSQNSDGMDDFVNSLLNKPLAKSVPKPPQILQTEVDIAVKNILSPEHVEKVYNRNFPPPAPTPALCTPTLNGKPLHEPPPTTLPPKRSYSVILQPKVQQPLQKVTQLMNPFLESESAAKNDSTKTQQQKPSPTPQLDSNTQNGIIHQTPSPFCSPSNMTSNESWNQFSFDWLPKSTAESKEFDEMVKELFPLTTATPHRKPVRKSDSPNAKNPKLPNLIEPSQNNNTNGYKIASNPQQNIRPLNSSVTYDTYAQGITSSNYNLFGNIPNLNTTGIQAQFNTNNVLNLQNSIPKNDRNTASSATTFPLKVFNSNPSMAPNMQSGRNTAFATQNPNQRMGSFVNQSIMSQDYAVTNPRMSNNQNPNYLMLSNLQQPQQTQQNFINLSNVRNSHNGQQFVNRSNFPSVSGVQGQMNNPVYIVSGQNGSLTAISQADFQAAVINNYLATNQANIRMANNIQNNQLNRRVVYVPQTQMSTQNVFQNNMTQSQQMPNQQMYVLVRANNTLQPQTNNVMVPNNMNPNLAWNQFMQPNGNLFQGQPHQNMNRRNGQNQ